MAENTPNSRRRGNPQGSGGDEHQQTPEQVPERQKPGGGAGGPGLRPSRGLFGILTVVSMVMLLFLLFNTLATRATQINWNEFANRYRAGDLSEISVTEDAINARQRATQADAEPSAVYVRITTGSRDVKIKDLTDLTGGNFREQPPNYLVQVLQFTLPLLIIILIVWMLFVRGLRSATGGPGGVLGNFGKSRHKVLMKEKTGVTFADVAGIDEAKDEVEEIIQFLKAPKKFMRLGGRIPRGVLLVGEPGCGKTLLAKAIAGEADVPFFSISGSDFVEMFVGVGASRVRDLFKQAKEAAPCIIFLDEIDAVGRRRGGGFTSGGHDEREQTLNAILVEMDGFNPSDGVIVIAATNRNDVLDPALIRPGRFDRQITVPLPDVKGRMEILRVHAKKVKLGPDVDLERLAKATPMFSGADLAAIINEAAIAATLNDKDWVEQEDMEEARDKVRFGRARKSRKREVEENRMTAFHEAGHAVLHMVLPDADPLHKVTIISRGAMGGTTYSLPEKDRWGYGLKWLRAMMRVACGGRIAETKATGDVSSGAVSDISQVTNIARHMVEEWGMSEKLGFVRYAAADTREMFIPEKSYSDQTAHLIDAEVRRIVDEAFVDAERLLETNWDKVVAVAEALLKHETLTGDEVARLMRGELLTKPTVSDLLAAEARKARENAGPTLAPPMRGEAPEAPPPSAMPQPA